MRIGRLILVALIGLSVAMLPVGGGRMAAAASPDGTAVEMTHDAAMPCHKNSQPMDDCASMIGCALKCFSVSPAEFSSLVSPPMTAEPGPSLASTSARSQTGTPPFRPPRI